MKEGRPKIGKTRGLNTSFYVSGEELEMLEEIRWREKKSMSALVRRAIDEYIASHKEGNDTFRLDNWNEDPNFKAVPTILSRQEIWYKYLLECSPQERMEIQKKAVSIKNQCLSIK